MAETELQTIKKDILTREQWLENRFNGIGASDVATIVGANPWKSAYTLYHEKRRELPVQEQTIAMEVGHFLEPYVAGLYEKETGLTLRDPGQFTVYRHDSFPELFCTPDRFAFNGNGASWMDEFRDGTAKVVELKTTGQFNAKAWREGDPPLDNEVQLQIQMAVLGLECGSLAGLVANREFHWFDRDRNDKLIKLIMPKLKEFWERVQNGDAPPVDGSDSTTMTLKILHPEDSGATVQMSVPPDTCERLGIAKVALKECEADKKQYENVIKAAIGAATFGTFEGETYSYKTQTRKGNVKVAVSEVPKLIEAGIEHEVKPETTFRVLRRVKA